MTLLSDMLFRLADSIKHGDRKTAVGVVERLVKLRLELCITESENHINNGIRYVDLELDYRLYITITISLVHHTPDMCSVRFLSIPNQANPKHVHNRGR